MSYLEGQIGSSVLKVIKDAIAVARIRLLMQSRMRSWFFSVPASGFFLVAPFVLLGKTIVGERGERLKPFLSLSGYDNYTGYLAVPLVFAFLTNSVYSWIGQAIRQEQQSGTLERTLISMRHPVSLTLGGAVAHLVFLSFFIAVGIASLSFIADLRLHINWPTAIVVGLAHLYAAYGLAFLLSSLFLWIRDAFIVQQVITFVVIPILSGAGFPIAIFPEWLQGLARAIPFTWAFELERAAFLKATPLGEVLGDFAALVGISTVLWLIGYPFFAATLRRARRTGHLGIY